MDKFHGTSEEFRALINGSGIKGEWIENVNGPRYRHIDGAVVQMYESNGTIFCQGKVQAKTHLEELLNQVFSNPEMKGVSDVNEEPNSEKKIFVVHGHDDQSREQLELVLLKLGLKPFVLLNTSGDGLTIIEALEKEIGKKGESKIGIVLFTPDDFGYSQKDGPDKIKPRARQNVVLEMGMLIAAVGRSNTIMLVKGDIEIPSDAGSIIYVSYKNHVKETVPKLVERLNNAGFNLDAKKITHAAS